MDRATELMMLLYDIDKVYVGFRRVDLQRVISIRLSWHCTLILPKVDF
jgi:hypothetical protein